MALSRSEENWSVLINEFNICKQKLQSKRESLKIMMKELDQAQIEKDVYKNKARQLQRDFEELKTAVGESWNNNEHALKFGENEKKVNTLTNLLQYSKDENGRLKTDLENIRQLYNDTQKDNILLRNSLTRQEETKKVNENGVNDKEKLIIQLEESLAKLHDLEDEVEVLREENKQIEDEKQSIHEKNLRLNTELNYILHNDDKRIVDIDTLVLENQYLKEVVKQYKEEKSAANNTVQRYKEALKQKRSTPTSPSKGQSEGFFTKSSNSGTIADLQRVNKALTEKLSEKDLALKHQRNTNRILGTRVHELEKKLKTLEISGLWSHEKRIPRQISLESFTTIEQTDKHKSLTDSPSNSLDKDDINGDTASILTATADNKEDCSEQGMKIVN